MTMNRTLRSVAVALFVGCATAHAATIEIVVERSAADAEKCNVSGAQLESIARLTLRNSRLDPAGGLLSPYLYIRPTVMQTAGGLCVAEIGVSIRQLIPTPAGLAFKPAKIQVVAIVLCEEGAILSGPAYNFGERIVTAVEQKIKVCLGQLDY